ncbi:hypothetical protein FRB99_005146 [Tulasnella sp. 403]|nr:hypothetical protein FRB99_005146 [Tulasnella sp. 403]
MRESNFSFPVQNRAAVVISSQLYDRRALDTTSPLPLFNSLTHLTYLTSTSPRIRDILTVDGGLERLVRLLREFCTHPPPPQSPRSIYGLKPAVKRKSKNKGKAPAGDDRSIDWLTDRPATNSDTQSSSSPTSPSPNPLTSFDRSAAFRFSLAFQCVVNIGVRGSEAVRARVVQAGMLDVVSSVLECWLVSKGFAVCPSPTGSGAPRESKEVRVARRLELLERRQRDLSALQAAELARALRSLPQGSSSNPNGQQGARNDVVNIPVVYRTAHQSGHSQTPDAAPAPNAGEETMFLDNGDAASHERPSSASDSASATEELQDESMDTEEETQRMRRRDTIRATSNIVIPSHQSSISDQTSESSITSASSSTSLPVPVPRRSDALSHSNSSGNVSDSVSADTSANATPVGGNTPTGSVTIEAQARERSGTVVGRPVWDAQQTASPSRRPRRTSASTRRHRHNDTGTDEDVTTEAEIEGESRGPQGRIEGHPARMAVIVQADPQDGPGMDMNIIMDQGPLQGVGIEQGLVNLDMQANDDLAMGAPPGAPGAVQNVILPPPTPATGGTQQQVTPGTTMGIGGATPRQMNDLTPRAGMIPLATATPTHANATQALAAARGMETIDERDPSILGPTAVTQQNPATAAGPAQTIPAVQLTLNGISAANMSSPGSSTVTGGSGEDQSAGPYREEDVLLSLQLLAYLSKYPHVRQAFYKNRVPLGPPLYPPHPPRGARNSLGSAAASLLSSVLQTSETNPACLSSSSPTTTQPIQHAPNVFSLVERFTFRPSPSELHLPRLPQEIQYWAGVIMRNACRKDETRGGIRQCANMVCGKWETYPREFAKCRRCRKAKYCGKECQSKAWADGHRFWCSSRDAEAADAAAAQADAEAANNAPSPNPNASSGGESSATGAATGGAQTRHRTTAGLSGSASTTRHRTSNGSAASTERTRSHHNPSTQTAAPSTSQSQRTSRTQPQNQAQSSAHHPLLIRVSNAARVARTETESNRSGDVSPTDNVTRHQVLAISAATANGAPRARIIQHAVPPTSPVSTVMDVDGRPVPLIGVRRRAGTLPGPTSPSPTPGAVSNQAQPRIPERSSGSSNTMAQAHSPVTSEAIARQETLRDMVRDVALERQRLGLRPLRGLAEVEQEISRLILNGSLDSSERSASLRRIINEFESVIDQERERASLILEQRSLRRDTPSVDEDGDARMGG